MWTGNLKKGTTIKKLLGYDPIERKPIADVKKLDGKGLKERINKRMGRELTTEEVIAKMNR